MMSLFCHYALALCAIVLARFLALCNPLSLVRRPVLFHFGPGPGSVQVLYSIVTCIVQAKKPLNRKQRYAQVQRHIFFKQYAGNHGLQYGSLHHEYHGGAHNTIAQDRPAWQAPPTPRRSAIKPPDNFGAFEALGSGMPDDSCKGARWEGNIFLLSQILAASEPWQIPLSKCVNTATHDASSRRSLPCCHCLQQQPLRGTILCTKLAISHITDHMAGCVELLLLQKINNALIYS